MGSDVGFMWMFQICSKNSKNIWSKNERKIHVNEYLVTQPTYLIILLTRKLHTSRHTIILMLSIAA